MRLLQLFQTIFVILIFACNKRCDKVNIFLCCKHENNLLIYKSIYYIQRKSSCNSIDFALINIFQYLCLPFYDIEEYTPLTGFHTNQLLKQVDAVNAL